MSGKKHPKPMAKQHRYKYKVPKKKERRPKRAHCQVARQRREFSPTTCLPKLNLSPEAQRAQGEERR